MEYEGVIDIDKNLLEAIIRVTEEVAERVLIRCSDKPPESQ